MFRTLTVAIILGAASTAHAEDLCVSRVSFVESGNILALQSRWSQSPALVPAEPMWAQMFAALVGADFPIEVETAIEGTTMWWKLDGMLFKQSPSDPAQSMEQAFANAMKPEAGGSLRLELDGEGCFKAKLDKDTLDLTTPTGNLLRITMTKRKVVKDASKNPKARVYEYKGPATLKLTQTTTPVEVDPNAPPPVLIERLDRPTVPTWAP